jgi:bis(5'-nucleosidyl)-tetraphosphatase
MKKDAAFGVIPIYTEVEGGASEHLFLLIKHQKGHWANPKGHAEEGEDPLETAQREFIEETGITQFEVAPELEFQEEYYPKVNGEVLHKTVTYFVGWVQSQAMTLQEEEVAEAAWLPYREALDRITFDPSKKMLKAVVKTLKHKVA